MRAIGVGLMLVAAGCATPRSTAVPVQPIALGQPTEVSRYELVVGDSGGGQLLLGAGGAVRDEAGRDVVRIGMRVENSSDRAMRLPSEELYVTNLAGRQIAPLEVNGAAVPDALFVPAGETRTFALTFALPAPLRIDDVRAFDLHWSLMVDGATAPITRATPFAAIERGRVYGPPLATGGSASRAGELPGFRNPTFGQNRSSIDRLGTQSGPTGHARGQALPPGY
jgi:hypothetical protein